MRTLTKERVDFLGLSNNTGTLNQGLIKDGANEMLSKKLSNLRDSNKKSSALAKQEDMLRAERQRRKAYAEVFISRCMQVFSLSRENMKDLVLGLKDKDIILLENTVLEKLKKPAILQLIGSFSGIAIFMGSILASFLFGNQAMIVLMALLFFTGLGWSIPFIFLTDFFYGYGRMSAMGYVGLQRSFKKRYGPEYFPYQELKETLGLVKND